MACQQEQMRAGKAYPRTCEDCGLMGPCRKGHPRNDHERASSLWPNADPARNLAEFIDRKRDWSLATFGPELPFSGILAHMAKEMKEIADDPKDVEEWIDVIFLALDGASRAGFTGKQIVDAWRAKHLKNLRRTWSIAAEGHFEHDRGDENKDRPNPRNCLHEWKEVSVTFVDGYPSMKGKCSRCDTTREATL